MPQVTLYIDKDTDSKARAAAEVSGVSYSRWVAELIRLRTRDEWPAAIRELAGVARDFPLRLTPGGANDIQRLPLD